MHTVAERELQHGDYVRTLEYNKERGFIIETADEPDGRRDYKIRIADSESELWLRGDTVVLIEAVESRNQMRRDFEAYLAAEVSENMDSGLPAPHVCGDECKAVGIGAGNLDVKVLLEKGMLPKAELPAEYEFVEAPKHYNDHPSGVECQEIIRECKDPMISFAMKHLWRSQWGTKPGETSDRDLDKALEYIQLEKARRAGVKRLA